MNFKGIKHIISVAFVAVAAMMFTACANDANIFGGSLHPENPNPQALSEVDFDALLNKIYANLSLTGQSGPAGSSDLPDDIDEGFSQLIRQVWNANELTSDEAHCVWGDEGIAEYNHNSWGDSHPMLGPVYYRLLFGITCANFFLDNAPTALEDYNTKCAEARFLRALYYYWLMDMFGNPPFLTHVSSEPAPQGTRAEVYEFLESELKDIIGEGEGSQVLAAAKSITYGRADIVAGYMLLSRLYLNAQVYTGEAKWAEARTYAEKAINSGYSILTNGNNGYSAYQLLFMGDNDTNGAQNEIVFPALYDGELTQTYGGTLFLMASTVNTADRAAYPTGSDGEWGGNHVRKQFVKQWFPNEDLPEGLTPPESAEVAGDDRALFMTLNHTYGIQNPEDGSLVESEFKFGYGYVKFLNIHSDGSTPKHPTYADTDFPVFRLAEAYLTYAEADARLNGGNCGAQALNYIKALRARANANTSISSFNLSQIESEWSKEFGFEGRRRMDLIRFGHFGGQTEYLWELQAGYRNGGYFPATRNIFAIPTSDLTANSNLKQNPGY